MHVTRTLVDGDIHLWQVDMGDAGWDRLLAVLSADEHEKAERFRTRELQQHYRRCRVALRTLLGEYAVQDAADIDLRYGEFGKPEMADQKLHFNLSHSGNRAIIGIALHPMGVDLEYMDRAGMDIAELLDLVCHPVEQAELARLDEPQRSSVFYRMWTQKEAYCKALGVGLQNSLPSLRFNDSSATGTALVIDERSVYPSPFFVHNLTFMAGYAASVCVPFADARVRVFAAMP
jgi:4'-phosphopantetheinyl transferase